MSKLSDMFLATFLGEEVMIVTSQKVVTQHKDGDLEEVPMTYHGYIVDADSMFVYIGPTFDVVASAVNKSCIVSIERMDAVEEAEALMDPNRPAAGDMN